MSDIGGTWGGSGLPDGRSGQGPSGITSGGNQTGAMPPIGQKQNPAPVPAVQKLDAGTGQAQGPEPARQAKPVMVKVTLVIPRDEYDDWKSALPRSATVIKSKTLDQQD